MKRAATASSKRELEVANQVPVAKQSTFELSSNVANVDFTKHVIDDLLRALTTAVLPFGLKHDGDFKGTLTRIDATLILDYEVNIEKYGIKIMPKNYSH